MPLSLLQRAKRAFVSVLLKLALDYGVAADVNRDSDDKVILQSYRRVVKKVHPDKGGNKKKFQALQSAKEAWDTARQRARPAGNPAHIYVIYKDSTPADRKPRRPEDQENERQNQRKTTSPEEQTNSKREDNKNR